MKLNDLKPAKGARRPPKRVGRGPGSGNGKTAGRGHKGYGSRSGSKALVGYEGGQMPLQRRIPKRGFTNIFRKEHQCVNVERLGRFEAGAVVDPEVLVGAGIVKKNKGPVKILGGGELAVPLTVKASKFSESARKKIEAAGGKAEEI